MVQKQNRESIQNVQVLAKYRQALRPESRVINSLYLTVLYQTLSRGLPALKIYNC